MQPAPKLQALRPRPPQPRQDPAWVRWGLIFAAVATLAILVIVPIANVFYQALRQGIRVYWQSLVADPDTRQAILLTLIVAPAAVAANLVFGIAAAWAIARFDFPGRTLLMTLIDLPFSVSPVVAGLFFVLLFGLLIVINLLDRWRAKYAA